VRIVVAIERHRRQLARLLEGLDDLQRAAVSDAAPALADGRETARFRYRTRGLMATIGRGAGVAELRRGGSGFTARPDGSPGCCCTS
jgi:hypothetical protein